MGRIDAPRGDARFPHRAGSRECDDASHLRTRAERAQLQDLCCAVRGPGGAVLRHLGFARYAGNPLMCNFCIKSLQKQGVQGAEIPVSLLFADIRGSTGIGERLTATEFRAFFHEAGGRHEAPVAFNDGRRSAPIRQS